MPRQTGEATRRAILDAAYELFYRKGYARVGVDEVAALAKVTKRTLYYHFRSKDDLLAEVLNWQAQLADARVRKYDNSHAAGNQRKFGYSPILSILGTQEMVGKARVVRFGMTRLATELADLPGHPARRGARRH